MNRTLWIMIMNMNKKIIIVTSKERVRVYRNKGMSERYWAILNEDKDLEK